MYCSPSATPQTPLRPRRRLSGPWMLLGITLAIGCCQAAPGEASDFYIQRLGTSNAYNQTRSYREYRMRLESDQNVLRQWNSRLVAEQQELRKLVAEYKEAEARLKKAREAYVESFVEYGQGQVALRARERGLEAVRASQSLSDLQERLEGVPRIGIVNDAGYAYRFYDEQGNRLDSAIAAEQQAVAAQAERTKAEWQRLKEWSSAISASAEKLNDIASQNNLSERLDQLKSSAAELRSHGQAFSQRQGHYNKSVAAENDRRREQARQQELRRQQQQAQTRNSKSQSRDYDEEALRRAWEKALLRRGGGRH